MADPLQIELDREPMRLLQLIAEAGILGGTIEEIAEYFILRELDDLLRCGAIKLGDGDA